MKIKHNLEIRMERILSQFESFSLIHEIDNPEIIVNENEILINSEILNFDIGSALVATILCIGLIFVSENGFGYLLFIFSLVFCYIIWRKLQYVNASHIDITISQISIKRKLIKNEYIILFSAISNFHVKYIEAKAAYRNYRVHIITVNNEEVKLIDFNDENAARDFARLMNLLMQQMKK